MKALFGWLWFVVLQALALAGFVVGLPLVAVLAALNLVRWRWGSMGRRGYKSAWRGGALTWLWGNDEDGVTGPSWYNPAMTRWLTFKWSALRNPVNNLRFLTAWKGGPWFQKRWAGGNAAPEGYYFQAGFRPDTGWPVLSAGRGAGTVL